MAEDGSRPIELVAAAASDVDDNDGESVSRSAAGYICDVGSMIRVRGQDAAACFRTGKKNCKHYCIPD